MDREEGRHLDLQHRRQFRITRDGIMFVGGFGGTVHETFFSLTERPFLLGMFATMMGLPFFLKLDDKRKDGGEGK